MSDFEQNLLKEQPLKVKTADGFEVRYMSPVAMGQFFGYAYQGKAFIRSGLSSRVERFVIAHELYHLKDKRRWLGWFGAELRANVACGIRDPFGLLATVFASLSKNRLTTYWMLMKSRGRKF